MKILIIHNKYGKHSGEETVVYSQIKLLKEYGHEVITYFRSSEEIETMAYGKLKALVLSLYNPKSINDLKKIINEEKPDLVHVHNLFPLISPAILPFIKSFAIPIVITVHNYRLLCPNGLFFVHNQICEKCTGKGKELNAVFNNCEKSMTKSLGYALRNFWARKKGYYTNNIDVFLCLTEFQKTKLVNNGLDEAKCTILNNAFEADLKNLEKDKPKGFFGFVGRISKEKGISIISEVATLLPNVNFKLAGSVHSDYIGQLEHYQNIELVGFLDEKEIVEFYKEASAIIFPSIWYEGFPLSLLEAMANRKPVIASNIGGIPEIIEDQKTGLLFKPNHANDLKTKIEFLIENPDQIGMMGYAGFCKVKSEYDMKNYYMNLIKVYNKVVL